MSGINYEFICNNILDVGGDILHLFEYGTGWDAASGGQHMVVAANIFGEKAGRNDSYTPAGHLMRAIQHIRHLKEKWLLFMTARLLAIVCGDKVRL